MTSIASQDNPESIQDFQAFNLHPLLLQAVEKLGYQTPTPIQAQAIPVAMQGQDVMGAAQTGTGKTAAFVLPILHRLLPYASTSVSPARHPVRALILTPTRELADQVAESVRAYSQLTPLRSTVLFGGVDMQGQTEALRAGVEVLIATPGRLLDHMEQRHVVLSQVSVLVLDEADRMLDMGFLPDLTRIVNAVPKARQSLLFSATFSQEIRRLSRRFLHQPVEIEVASRNTTADTVSQCLFEVNARAKQQVLVDLLKEKSWTQVIVFSNTRAGAGRLARHLQRQGLKAEAIHGDKNQTERMRVLEAFKAEEVSVLVATDVAARGLDIAGVAGVINFELPFHAEDYVHRIGRTGRAGAKGEAISLVDTKAEARQLADIEALIDRSIERQTPPSSAASQRATALAGRGTTSDDPIFSQPYVPQTDNEQAEPARRRSAQHRSEGAAKRSVGILLGGK